MEPHEASAKERGEGVLFERVRRITGYLVGTLERFNNAKRAEEHDRVKHGAEVCQAPEDTDGSDGKIVKINNINKK